MTQNHNLFAAFLAVLGSAVVSLTDNFVNAVQETAGLWQFQVFKAMFAIPVIWGAAVWRGLSLRPKNLTKLTVRSLAIAVGLLIYFASLGALPVAQAGAGLYSAPIWIMLLSVLFLGKRIGWRRIAAMMFGFAGVLALLQPDLNNLTALSALPLLAGVFYGLGALATKALCSDEHPLVLAFGVFVTIGVIATGLLIYFTLVPASSTQFHAQGWVPLTGRFLWLTLGQAVGASIAIAVLANAYRFGEPDFVSVCEYSFLVFAAIWALILWDEPTNLVAQIGIFSIILSGVCMYLLDRRPETAPNSQLS